MKQKMAERKADALFNEMANCIQFNIMDLGKLIKPVQDAFINGETEEAVRTVMTVQIAKYRQN